MQLDVRSVVQPINLEEGKGVTLEEVPRCPNQLFPAGDWDHEPRKVVGIEDDIQDTLDHGVHP